MRSSRLSARPKRVISLLKSAMTRCTIVTLIYDGCSIFAGFFQQSKLSFWDGNYCRLMKPSKHLCSRLHILLDHISLPVDKLSLSFQLQSPFLFPVQITESPKPSVLPDIETCSLMLTKPLGTVTSRSEKSSSTESHQRACDSPNLSDISIVSTGQLHSCSHCVRLI